VTLIEAGASRLDATYTIIRVRWHLGLSEKRLMRTAAKQRVLLPLAALLATGAVGAAEVTSPKIIIGNMTAQEIPITGTVNVQADGDIRVECRLDEQDRCPSIGSGSGGSSGSNPPTITSFTPSATTITEGGSFSLSWQSNGEVCYALEPEAITNWTSQTNPRGRAYPPSGSQSLSLGEGEYVFGLRCYTAGGSTTTTTATVTVEKGDETPPPGNYCDEYYSGTRTKPTVPAFTAFNFTKVEESFVNMFGILPGDVMPSSDMRWVPGNKISQAANHYLTIPFVMREDSTTSPLSQFQLRWFLTQIPGAVSGAVSVTISPCPGDFRPSAFPTDPNDLYTSNLCRATFNTQGALTVDSTSQTNGCFAPKDKQMYINVAPSNMFGGVAPTTTSCPSGQTQCGVSMRHD
jgi:hypothetical protein